MIERLVIAGEPQLIMTSHCRTPQPQVLTVNGGGVPLRLYDYGNEGAVPMVLVHGIQDFSLSLSPIAEAFRDRYRVIAFDLRGHGDSAKPGVYTFSHFLADLHGVVCQLELARPVLVGHSLGGQLVTHYAGIFAEVPQAVVSIEGLGPPFRGMDMPTEIRRSRTRTGIERLLGGGSERRPMASLEQAIELFRRSHPAMPAETARRLVELGTEPHPVGGLQWKWDPLVQTTWLSTSPQQSEERWGWIECPVLLVTAGRADEFWRRNRGIDERAARIDPRELARRVELFEDAKHVEIEGAGHMVHYDAPEELIDAMEELLGEARPGPEAESLEAGSFGRAAREVGSKCDT